LRAAGIPLRPETTRMKMFAKADERPGPRNNWLYATPAVREPE